MAEVRSNRILVIAVLGSIVLLGAILSLTKMHFTKAATPSRPFPAHDKPIVISDGSIHITTENSEAFQQDSASNYHSATNNNSVIHIRFDDGQPPVDFSSLSNWKIHLAVSDANKSEKITLCPDVKCSHEPVDSTGRVYILVSGGGKLTASDGGKRLDYSDTSSGCQQVAMDEAGLNKESVCVHLRRIRVSTKDSDGWHIYRCDTGNCTVTVGDPAKPPELLP